MESAFDTLALFRKLEAAGVDPKVAEIHAEAFRAQSEANYKAVQDAIARYDEESRKTLATKADILALRGDMRELGAELRVEIQQSENRIRNWLIGILIAFVGAAFGGLGLAYAILSRPG